ncbi:TPA: Lin1244/Lin1753 domain-containing protein [Listeria monocytogenes]
MARPLKEGLDYFPLDVDADYDDKFQLIETLHGPTGFAIMIKLFMKIYSQNFFYKWTETEQILFAKRVNVDINTLKTVVNDCIKYDLFNNNLFNEFQILTSLGIQERYFTAIGRRKKQIVVLEYLLLDRSEVTNLCPKIVFTNINGVNDDINTEQEGLMSTLSTQTKVKESKVNKSKAVGNAQEKKDVEISKEKPAATAYKFWEENVAITGLSEFDRELLKDLISLGGNELTVHAMKKAIELNRRRMKTVDTVLRGWLDNGVKTTAEADEHEKNWNGGAKNNARAEPAKETVKISDKYNFEK